MLLLYGLDPLSNQSLTLLNSQSNPFARLMVILSQSYVSTAASVLNDIPTHSCLAPGLSSGLTVMRVISFQLAYF